MGKRDNLAPKSNEMSYLQIVTGIFQADDMTNQILKLSLSRNCVTNCKLLMIKGLSEILSKVQGCIGHRNLIPARYRQGVEDSAADG